MTTLRLTEEQFSALSARANGPQACDRASGGVPVAPPTSAFASEAEFQAALIKAAKRMGWKLAYHTFDSRRSSEGWPDLVLANVTQRRVVFAELKSTTGRLSDEQAAWIGALTVAGFEVFVWRPENWDAALAVLAGGVR